MYYLTINSSMGHAYRVSRRGYHYVVENHRRAGWQTIAKVEIVDEHDHIPALRAALRKAIGFAEDDVFQSSVLLWMVKQETENVAVITNPFLAIQREPRDANLHSRIPKTLKEELCKDLLKTKRALEIELSLTDLVIHRLRCGRGTLG